MLYAQPVGYKANSKVKATLASVVYYPFHLHKDDLEIVYVLNGKATVFDSALAHDLSFGDAYVFNANDPHKIVSHDAENILLTIQMSRSYYESFFPTLANAFFICDSFTTHDFHNIELKHLRFLGAKLYDRYTMEPVCERTIEECARELIDLLLAHFCNYTYKKDAGGKISIVRLSKEELAYRDYERMYRIVDYVAAHYKEKITLREIAEKEYLSPSHLSRYIKSTLGLTFSELVSVTRCEEAERLLSATAHTIDQIAEMVGFANRRHLATQFKRWFEKTPTQYRVSLSSDLNNRTKAVYQTFSYDFAMAILQMYLDGY